MIKCTLASFFILIICLASGYSQSGGSKNPITPHISETCLGPEKQKAEKMFPYTEPSSREWNWPSNMPKGNPNPSLVSSMFGEKEILLSWLHWPAKSNHGTVLGLVQKRDINNDTKLITFTYRQILPECEVVRKSVIASLVKEAFYGKYDWDFSWEEK